MTVYRYRNRYYDGLGDRQEGVGMDATDPYLLEAKHISEAKVRAAAEGLEVLTPLGARSLFGKSAEAVRKAVRLGHVVAPLALWATERGVALISLESALDYWGLLDYEQLDEMRARAHNIAMPMGPRGVPEDMVTYRGHNVLHPSSLVTLRNSEVIS